MEPNTTDVQMVNLNQWLMPNWPSWLIRSEFRAPTLYLIITTGNYCNLSFSRYAFLSDYLTDLYTGKMKINFIKNCPQWGLKPGPLDPEVVRQSIDLKIRRSWFQSPLGAIFDELFSALPCVKICQIIWQKRLSWKTQLKHTDSETQIKTISHKLLSTRNLEKKQSKRPSCLMSHNSYLL